MRYANKMLGKLIDEQKLTNKIVGHICGVSPEAVSQWKTDKNLISISSRGKLIKKYGLAENYFDRPVDAPIESTLPEGCPPPTPPPVQVAKQASGSLSLKGLVELDFAAVEESIRIVLRMRGLKPAGMTWHEEKVLVTCDM